MSDISLSEPTANVASSDGVRGRLGHLFSGGGRKFLPLYALGVFSFLLSFPISMITGTRPDVATVSGFALVLGMLFVILAVVLVIGKFFHMAIVERPESPSRALGQWIVRQVTQEQRLSNTFHMLMTMCLFLMGFAVLKGSIAVLHPFAWDQTLLEWDKALHFGRLPHEWLSFIMNSPAGISFFNFFYNLWFFVLVSSLIVSGLFASRSQIHIRYLAAFMLTWFIPGFLIATGFSSAGPCFYERAGFGTDYVPLMDSLKLASESVAVWALPTQDLLWEGYAGTRDGSVGISAFPSLHVATAVLLAFYAGSRGRAYAILGWVFALIILIGSVVLGWHYAVDGYIGGILAVIIWKLTPHLPGLRAQ